jgi:hypothetical protein
MTVTVQASDTNGTALQARVTALQTALNAAAASNPAQVLSLTLALDAAQITLVSYLMGNNLDRTQNAQFGIGAPNFLSASGILSAGTVNT